MGRGLNPRPIYTLGEVRAVIRFLIAIVLLAGCTTGDPVGDSNNVRRHHDSEYNVTCWVVGQYRGGIDCISDHELRPDQ